MIDDRNHTLTFTLELLHFTMDNLAWKDSRHLRMKMATSTSFDLTRMPRGLYGLFVLRLLSSIEQVYESLVSYPHFPIPTRIQSSCERTMMPHLPTEKFLEAVNLAVRDNIEYVPPYGSNGALYIRPLLFGSGPRIGLQPADEYTFIVIVMPVGDYYHGGLAKPVDGLIIGDFGRAAPRGVGNVKVAGNYAADLLPNMLSKKKGFPIGLYLDARTRSTVEEFSTSNFVGIENGAKKYVTPNPIRFCRPLPVRAS